jgi:hypothetical protein
MYKLNKDLITNEIKSVKKDEGNIILTIPFDLDNSDYQAYLKWVADGNTPESAE